MRPMFVVYCPRHQSQVLLFTDDIEAVVNRRPGIELHWHCPCGERGVTDLLSDEPLDAVGGAA